ncbi:hypothetical protein FRC17_006326 [Serendipita sp. 399]|nr:hypothetical protein FRC17_006326 [Serendipita sp. 399]
MPNKAVAALSGKNMSASGKNSAVQSRGSSPKPNIGNSSRQGSPSLTSGQSMAGPARASSPSGSKSLPPPGIGGHSRSPSASGTSTPVVGAQALKRKAPNQGGETPFKRQRTASPPDNPSQKASSTPSTSTPAPQAQKSKSKLEKPHADFPGCLTKEMVVNYLQEREAQGLKTRTKDAIEKFKPMWATAKSGPKEGVDERNKDLLIYWIQKVANLEGEKGLVLRRSGH